MRREDVTLPWKRELPRYECTAVASLKHANITSCSIQHIFFFNHPEDKMPLEV